MSRIGARLGMGVAAAMTAGVLAGGTGVSEAATVTETSTHIFVGFTPAETKQIAASGVGTIFNDPAIRPYYYVSPDQDTRYERLVIPGKGRVVRATVQKLVREAAQHRNGRVWVSFNKRSPRPLTVWTRF